MEDRSAYVLPLVNELRAHDGTYSTHYAPPDIEHANVVCEQCIFALTICSYCRQNPIQCLARTADGRDILIRLITEGETGLEQLDVLHHVAIEHSLGNNHGLPML